MKFSDYIPTALQQYDNAMDFVEVLDGVQLQKELCMETYTRLWSVGTMVSPTQARKRLSDYGIEVPSELPFDSTLALLANAGAILNLKGSILGLEMYLSAVYLGEAVITFETRAEADYITLDLTENSWLSGDSEDPHRYCPADTDEINVPLHVRIKITSPYATNSAIRDFVKSSVKEWLPFNSMVEYVFNVSSKKKYHTLFVKTFSNEQDNFKGV